MSGKLASDIISLDGPEYQKLTYRPPWAEKQFRLNEEQIVNKEYADYFYDDWTIQKSSIPAFDAPMPQNHVLRLDKDLNRLLTPEILLAENGFCAGYTASLTTFPKPCTKEMIEWWFHWHSVEKERYTLWFPQAHISALAQNRKVLTQPDLTCKQRWMGNKHVISEYIGPAVLPIVIEFKPASTYGLDEARFEEAGIEVAVCGDVRLRYLGLKIATMIHLWYKTDGGMALRSRYYMHSTYPLTLVYGPEMRDVVTGEKNGRKLTMAENIAREQLLHDQIEFTHLSSILPGLYARYGPNKKGTDLSMSEGAKR